MIMKVLVGGSKQMQLAYKQLLISLDDNRLILTC